MDVSLSQSPPRATETAGAGHWRPHYNQADWPLKPTVGTAAEHKDGSGTCAERKLTVKNTGGLTPVHPERGCAPVCEPA